MLDTNILLFIILGIIFVLVIICLVLALINSSKISAFLDYSEDGDLMAAVKEYYNKVDELADTISNSEDAVIQNRLTGCETEQKFTLRQIGIVNFDAFDDVTGAMSFALTVLDSHKNGFILTSIYGHSSCNTYIREIKGGVSSVKLLNEEKESLQKAINQNKGADSNG